MATRSCVLFKAWNVLWCTQHLPLPHLQPSSVDGAPNAFTRRFTLLRYADRVKKLILTVSDWLIVLVKLEWWPLKEQGVSLSAVPLKTLTGATVDNAVAESPVNPRLKFRRVSKTANKALTGGNSDPYLELYRRLANSYRVLYPTYYQAYSLEANVDD